ncbi:probable Guanosine-diphosphatase [Zygosaccharomyces bailii]|nr:probable Guanosine-diphosphatase [Zygosaccharomyces bailii]
MVRNYRFVIGAFAAVMLLLLIRSSTTVRPAVDIVRNPAPTAKRPDVPQDFNIQPVAEGWVDDEKAEQENPALAQAVKEQTTGATNSDTVTSSSNGPCTKEHQYVIMIDAGSTGSRVHIYEFDVCTQPPTLIEETFKMLNPGLSSFKTDATGAALSLDPLLNRALEVVPEKKRSCTPVAVKATAGLRLLGAAKSDKILAAVREHLEKEYPFPVVEGDGISIMSGEEEGVYAWVTTNYLLGNIGGRARTPTAAVFDLGGGSTQIVFEPTFPPNEKMAEGEHKFELSFGGEQYILYQFSHLGYGLMQGRNKINSLLVETAIKEGTIQKGDTATVHELISPCLPPQVVAPKEEVKLADGETYVVTFSGPVTAAGAQCRFLADKILNKDAECSELPCSFNGVHQPSLVHTFKETNDIYVFSYFYDRTQPLGLPLSFKLDELVDLAKMVCNGEEVWKSVFSGIDGSIQELKKEPQWCLDLSFQVALLHTGYEIPLHRELRTAKTIAQNELGWCLGASLPLIEGNSWRCKVSQVS